MIFAVDVDMTLQVEEIGYIESPHTHSEQQVTIMY